MRILLLLLAALCSASVAAPPPGHPSADSAANALNLPRDDGVLPYVGRVLIAVDSNSYTYIKLTLEDGSTRWLSAPRSAVPVGSKLRFGEGMLMRNFYSKRLKHQFAEITFVRRVQVMTD